eukprot:3039772-Prymnesium_polylepis.1
MEREAMAFGDGSSTSRKKQKQITRIARAARDSRRDKQKGERSATGRRRVRTHSHLRIREGFTKVRDRFARGSHKFARVCAGYNTVP